MSLQGGGVRMWKVICGPSKPSVPEVKLGRLILRVLYKLTANFAEGEDK